MTGLKNINSSLSEIKFPIHVIVYTYGYHLFKGWYPLASKLFIQETKTYEFLAASASVLRFANESITAVNEPLV
jgi:hypothetical protein